MFKYRRALGLFNLNPALAKLVPPPKKPKHYPGRVLSDYLKLDCENRQMMKTNSEDVFLLQAELNQRWFGENKSLSTRHVWHLVKRYSRLSGIGNVSRHDLRRTAITPALKQRVPIGHIQRMSGHQDLNTRRFYDLDRENLEDNAINKLTYDS